MTSENAALIGSQLRRAREERGWTRRRLAQEMDGIATENDIYRWEAGKHRPRDDALAAAARALNKPFSYFFDDETASTPDVLDALDDKPTHLRELEQRLSALEDQIAALRLESEARDLEVLKLLGAKPLRRTGSQRRRPR